MGKLILVTSLIGMSAGAVCLPSSIHADDNLARLDAFISDYAKHALYSGYVLVAKGDTVIFQKGYGKANFEFGVPNTADTRFRIASISKSFTKIALATLLEDGELGPDETLEKQFPALPRSNEISVRHLLDDTSGIAHLNSLPWYDELAKTNISLAEIISRLTAVPLSFDPGTDRGYSNGAYAVMAALIEKISGKDYYRYLHEDVLGPLQLHDTGAERPFSVVERLASGYKPGPRGGLIAKPRFAATAIKIGGGGCYSTPNDLLKFSRLLYRDNLLSEETWETILPRREVLFLDGRRPGFCSHFIRDSKHDLTIINLSNMYLGSFGFDDALLNITTGKATSYRSLKLARKTYSKTEAREFIGEFILEPIGTFVEIAHTSQGGLVYKEPNLGSQFAFLTASEGGFYATQYDMFCTPVDGTYECTPRLSDFELRLRPVTPEERAEIASRAGN